MESERMVGVEFELMTGWTILGHASYMLLIASMLMRRMLPLRLLAIASGVLGILYSTLQVHDWVSATWESAFVAANLGWVVVLVYQRARSELSDEERRLRGGALSELSPHEFLALRSIGRWQDVHEGDVLARQGQMITELVLLVGGLVRIEIDGNVVAHCRPGDFVGEISVLSNAPATATATAITSGRCLSFRRYELRRLLATSPGLERSLGRVFTQNLIQKLVETSAGDDRG